MTQFFVISLCLLISTLCRGANIPYCPENEYFTTCAPPPYCQASCQNNTIVMCPAICVSGCACKEGYIRESERGACVQSCEEISICEENEVFLSCGTACPESCGDDNNEDKVCPAICVRGCFCRDDYVRASDGGKCIPRNQCGQFS